MTHFYKALLAVILFPLLTSAQSNYKPGYVVTLQGDTLKGFIDYKEWDKNPVSINFKATTGSSEGQYFTVKNAGSFAITGLEYYQRFILSISQDQVDIGKVTARPDTTHITDTVFLRLSTKGKYLALYSYTDNIKRHFFLLDAGDPQPEELVYQAYYNPDESSSIHHINRYRGQLQFLAQKYAVNNGNLDKQILAADYREPDLANIVQTINGSTGPQFKTQNLAGSRWFAGIGVNYSNLKFTEPPFTGPGGTGAQKSSVNNNTSIFPEIKAGIDFFPNKSVQSLLIRIELSASLNQFKVTNTYDSGTVPSTSSINFTQYNSALTPQIIYNIYNKAKLKAFIGGGIALNFSAYNKYQYIINYGSLFPEIVQNNYPVFSNFWVSFPIRAGVAINNKIEISICYVPSSSITTDNVAPSANITSYRAGVNYLFGK